MKIRALINAVVENIRTRVRNGEFTERALARLLGISQPHVHNILKGARALTPELADSFAEKLNISLDALWRDLPPHRDRR
ncbi:MAG: helix-turn-helix transcriptional regulator [Bryobacteraceae bacterium]